jgi:hypothetical protein
MPVIEWEAKVKKQYEESVFHSMNDLYGSPSQPSFSSNL